MKKIDLKTMAGMLYEAIENDEQIEMRDRPECHSNQVEVDDKGEYSFCYTCGWKAKQNNGEEI